MSKSLRPVWGIFVILCAVVAVALLVKALRPAEIIPWRNDFAAAQTESRQTSRPVFAYFTADWCAPCQGLKTTTWADERVELALRSFVPVRIDVDRHADLAGEYGVRAVPTYIILAADGHALRQVDGALTPLEMVEWLRGGT